MVAAIVVTILVAHLALPVARSRLSFVPVGLVRVPLPPYGVAVVNALVGADVSQARPFESSDGSRPGPCS